MAHHADLTARDDRPAREWSVWVALFLLVAVLSCGSADVESDAGQSDPTEAVTALLEGYLAALEARDSAGIRAAIREDGRFVWLEDGALRYWSVDGILESLDAFPPDLPISTRTEEITVVPVGERGAHAWAGFNTRIGEGEQAYLFGGMLSFVLERGADGWRIVGGHTSTSAER